MEKDERKKHIPLKKSILNFGRNLLPLAYFHAPLSIFSSASTTTTTTTNDDQQVLHVYDVDEHSYVDVHFDVANDVASTFQTNT